MGSLAFLFAVILIAFLSRAVHAADRETVDILPEVTNEQMASDFGVRSMNPNVAVYRMADVPIRRPVSYSEEETYEEPIFEGPDRSSRGGWSFDTTQKNMAPVFEQIAMEPVGEQPAPTYPRKRRPVVRNRQLAPEVIGPSTKTPGGPIKAFANPVSGSAPTVTTSVTSAKDGKGMPTVQLVLICIICALMIILVFGGLIYRLMRSSRKHGKKHHHKRVCSPAPSLGVRPIASTRDPGYYGEARSVIHLCPNEPIAPDQGPLIQPQGIAYPRIPVVELPAEQPQPKPVHQQVRTVVRAAQPAPIHIAVPVVAPAPVVHEREPHMIQVTAPLRPPPVTPSHVTAEEDEPSTGSSDPPILGIIEQAEPDHESVGANSLPADLIEEIKHPHRQS